MTKEQTISYVMSEEIHHGEKQKNNQTNNSQETLRSFHHNVSHLDEMISKINAFEKGAVKNTNTVDILNTLLQKSGVSEGKMKELKVEHILRAMSDK